MFQFSSYIVIIGILVRLNRVKQFNNVYAIVL